MTGLPDPSSPAAAAAAGITRYATVFKMASVAILVLLLLVPLAMVHAVLRDRLQRRDAAVREMTASWGSEQTVFGPVLIVPYRHAEKTWKEQVVNGRVERMETTEMPVRRAYFLPAKVKAVTRLEPTRLHRGIYESVVYRGTIGLSGEFARPSFEEWTVAPQHVMWEEAEIALAVTDLRGAREAIELRAGASAIALKPGLRLEGLKGGVFARIPGLSAEMESLPFEVELTLNGHRSLRFAPVGVTTEVTVSSTWPDPSFQGAFLPSQRDVRADGFEARWQVSHYGRSYSQQWTDTNAVTPALVKASLFGVDLVPALDSYRFVERAIKYGVLVLALVFSAFFLFEVLAAARVHPFQYSLVGAAICLFYLALLALSEVLVFGAAYWAGAAAATLMISLYCVKALRSRRRGGVAAAGLAVVFAFLYVILRLQDLSLLVGTAGLFLVLAIVMYVTRNIDWYARDGA